MADIITVRVGGPEFAALFGDLLTDRDFADQLWRDSETTIADLLGVKTRHPQGPKLLTVAVVDGQPAAWAGHQLVIEDGETVVKATDSYDRRGYRHLRLYPAVYAARQVLVEAMCAELGVDAITYVYIDPLWLHVGWRIEASGVSEVEGLDPHRWYRLRWDAGRTMLEPPPSMTTGATMTDERVLESTQRPALYTWEDDEETLRGYRSAVDAGRVLRRSANPVDTDNGGAADYVRVVEYVDPETSGTRFLVDIAEPDGAAEWADYGDRGTAEAAYESFVRLQEAQDWLYESTDVDGVAELDPGTGVDD